METSSTLLSDSIKHLIESRDEWDPNTTLYQPYEVEQILMPDNANCLAVQTFLKMMKLRFNVEYRMNAEHMSPTGNVPFIKSGSFVEAELESIIEFCKNKGHDLTSKEQQLTEKEICDMRSFMSLIRSVLENAENYIIWCDQNNVQNTEERYSHAYPFPINYWTTFWKRRTCKKRLNAEGWLDKNDEEVCQEVTHCCTALADRLGDAEYFFKEPTELDALLFGHIYTILTTTLASNKLQEIVNQFDVLINHCRRIEIKYFGKSTILVP